jgi:hypothetical protein
MKDGGSAFPCEYGAMDYRKGMSLHQWYKGQALASGMCPFNVHDTINVSGWCAKIATAMLLELKDD